MYDGNKFNTTKNLFVEIQLGVFKKSVWKGFEMIEKKGERE